MRSVIKKRTPHQFDYEEAKKKFVLEIEGYRFPIEGPVTRKYTLQWNKMNPNYYLCVYGYEGLNEKTDSILFVNSLRPFILPSEHIKNKKAIYLIIATPPELCQEIDSLKDDNHDETFWMNSVFMLLVSLYLHYLEC